jgi:hypothetical protein
MMMMMIRRGNDKVGGCNLMLFLNRMAIV